VLSYWSCKIVEQCRRQSGVESPHSPILLSRGELDTLLLFSCTPVRSHRSNNRSQCWWPTSIFRTTDRGKLTPKPIGQTVDYEHECERELFQLGKNYTKQQYTKRTSLFDHTKTRMQSWSVEVRQELSSNVVSYRKTRCLVVVNVPRFIHVYWM
jgi:hypothetical protein